MIREFRSLTSGGNSSFVAGTPSRSDVARIPSHSQLGQFREPTALAAGSKLNLPLRTRG